MKRLSKKNKSIFWVILLVLLCVAAGLFFMQAEDFFARMMYKQEHIDLVKETAEEYNLDVYLVAAVVKIESDYNENAVSSHDARGLMQVLPDTGEWIAGKLGLEDYSHDMLFQPSKNLMMGCWYLRFLYDRFDGDVELLLSAYNAGQGNVDSWLDNSEYSSDGKTLDVIPVDETKNYVEKVLEAYGQYQKLYPAY